MPANLEKINQTKEKILSIIRMRGPSLPVQIARLSSMEPLFASAFLSELYNEGKIKISNMKVGSSPLYFLPGQENLLENFINHLNQREKEAFNLIKRERVLEDEKQTPVVRVALRAIKDFAIPVRARVDGQEKNFWKHFMIQDQELQELISNTQPVIRKQEPKFVENQIEKTPENVNNPIEENEESKTGVESLPKKEITEKPVIQRKVSKDKDHFLNEIKEVCSNKNIILNEILSYDKKEIFAKANTESKNFLLYAINKKKADEKSIKKAFKKAQQLSMPYLIIARSEAPKSLQDKKEMYSSLISLEFFE